MSYALFQFANMVVLLALALWLFARSLPPRDGFWQRAAVTLVAAILILAASSEVGFSLYPSVTDDVSFVRASVSFVVVLAFLVAVQVFLWDCTPLTALYCSTSAYLLANLSDGFVRLLRVTGLVPGNPEAFLSNRVPLSDIALSVAVATVIYLAAHQVITRYLRGAALQRVNNLPMLATVTLAILVSIIFDLAVKDIALYEIPARFPVVFSLVHLAMGCFILFTEFEIIYNHTLQADLSTMERAMAEQERQFELSRSTIAAINRRCHDIRHHILRVLAAGAEDGTLTREEMAEVARGIDVYENVLRTGNAALDVVLTEKGLLARQDGITLSCVADGHALDFMASADLYALFASMLDGCIAAVRQLPTTERRSISLNVRDRMGMAAISVEHYLPVGYLEDSEDRRMGELILRTILEVVERYDGTMTTGDEDSGVLHIDLLIPQG